MRIILISCLFCVSIFPALAQEKISDKEWDALTKPLSEEKWKTAEQLSLKYLNRFKGNEDTLEAAEIIRYMYLRCVAARLAEKQYEPAVALAKVSGFKGKSIITPFIVFRYGNDSVFNGFNVVTLSDDKKNFFLCGANNIATQIHTFETYSLNDTTILSHLKDIENHQIRMQGVIESIKTGGVTMPHFEIKVKTIEMWE